MDYSMLVTGKLSVTAANFYGLQAHSWASF